MSVLAIARSINHPQPTIDHQRLTSLQKIPIYGVVFNPARIAPPSLTVPILIILPIDKV